MENFKVTVVSLQGEETASHQASVEYSICLEELYMNFLVTYLNYFVYLILGKWKGICATRNIWKSKENLYPRDETHDIRFGIKYFIH